MSLYSILFLFLTSFSAILLADEISLENLGIENPNASKIDWSKPIVSRGFGLEKSQGESDEASLKQYQSGQVFYFFGEYEKAVEKWLPLLESQFPEAQASMGWLYQAGFGVKKDINKARELYQKAAEQHNAIAQNNLGVMYENGISVNIDLKQAQYWYEQSAEQGYRFGQYNLASVLLLDKVTAELKANESAFSDIKKWLTLAANQGVKQAQEKLSSLRP